MASALKCKLSGSTDGKLVTVVATASTGTTIHTATNSTTDGASGTYDEVWLWATNTDTAACTLTIQWGGTTSGDAIALTIPAASGLMLIVPGMILQNSDVVRAYAGSASKVLIGGYVNRITS